MQKTILWEDLCVQHIHLFGICQLLKVHVFKTTGNEWCDQHNFWDVERITCSSSACFNINSHINSLYDKWKTFLHTYFSSYLTEHKTNLFIVETSQDSEMDGSVYDFDDEDAPIPPVSVINMRYSSKFKILVDIQEWRKSKYFLGAKLIQGSPCPEVWSVINENECYIMQLNETSKTTPILIIQYSLYIYQSDKIWQSRKRLVKSLKLDFKVHEHTFYITK